MYNKNKITFYVLISILYLILMSISIIIELNLSEYKIITRIVSFLAAADAVFIASMDSKINNKSMPLILSILVFFLWPLTLLICLVRTRGWKGFVWYSVHLILIIASLLFVKLPFIAYEYV